MLSDAQIRALKAPDKPIRRSDGGGLFIQVEKSGVKKWRIAYRFDGKQRLLAGGIYPAVGLAAARQWRSGVKEILARGADPSAVRKAEQKREAFEKSNSFEAVAREWIASRELLLDARYAGRVTSHFERDVFDVIGAMPIDEVTGPVLLEMLRRIEKRGAIESSHRVRSYCGLVFRYAIAEGRATHDPSSDVKPAQKSKAPVVHRAKVQPNDMGSFLVRLRDDHAEEMTHLAMHLTILTWGRTQEIRFAAWSEFENLDGEEPMWRIPAARMKMRNEHVVPLSRQAVAVLRQLKVRSSRSKWVLPVPGTKSGVISENRMLDTLYRMGLRGKATMHGFRGTASTWANGTLKYHPDVIEMALAHIEQNSVRGAYNAAQYLAPRRQMLQDWADWLDTQVMMAEVLG